MKIQAFEWVNRSLHKYAGQVIGGITITGDGAGLVSGICEDNLQRKIASSLGVISGVIMFCFGQQKEQSEHKTALEKTEAFEGFFTRSVNSAFKKYPKQTSAVLSAAAGVYSGAYYVANAVVSQNSKELVHGNLLQTARFADTVTLPKKYPIESASALALGAGGMFIASGLDRENYVEVVKGSLLASALAIMIFGKEHDNVKPTEASPLSKAWNWASRSPVQTGSLLFKGVTISSIADGINRDDRAMIASGFLFLAKDIMQFLFVKKNSMGSRGHE